MQEKARFLRVRGQGYFKIGAQGLAIKIEQGLFVVHEEHRTLLGFGGLGGTYRRGHRIWMLVFTPGIANPNHLPPPRENCHWKFR